MRARQVLAVLVSLVIGTAVGGVAATGAPPLSETAGQAAIRLAADSMRTLYSNVAGGIRIEAVDSKR